MADMLYYFTWYRKKKYLAIYDKTPLTNGRHAVLLYLIQKKTKVPGDTRQYSLDKWPTCCTTLPDTEKNKSTWRYTTKRPWQMADMLYYFTWYRKKQKYLAIHDKTVLTNGRHAVLLYLIQKKTKVPGDTRQNSLDKWPICCITLPDTEKKVPEDTRQNSLDKWSICCITLPDTEKQTKVPEDTRQNSLDKWPTCCITLPDTEKSKKYM